MKFKAQGRVYDVADPTGEHLATAFDIAGAKGANPIRLAAATFAAAGGKIDDVRHVYEDLLSMPLAVAGVLAAWSNGQLATIGAEMLDGADRGPLAEASAPVT
jgi:hypothetical protein